MDAVELATSGAATGLIAKTAVDLYRRSPLPSPTWALPTAAFVFAILGGLGLMYYETSTLTGPSVAYALIIGFIGGAGAILATEIHKAVRKDEPVGPEKN